MGATATGKTALAAALCDAFSAELINVDAAQIYRGMDIGTGKPSREFLRDYPHHLMDIRAPDEAYDAAQFRDDAVAAIRQIHAAGNLPILVGGTMFYFAALQHGLSVLPSADAETRRRLDTIHKEKGADFMHQKLREVDPKLAAKIKPGDRQRVQRALEIYEVTKQPPSEIMAKSSAVPLANPIIKLGLFVTDRKVFT